jgi:hypothetical protein
MIFSDVLPADEPASDDVRDRIKRLVSQIQAQPANEVPLLQLAHLYAQIWIRNRQPEIFPRIVGCLQRAISLETGHYAPQVRQILAAVGKQAANLGLQDALAQLRTLQGQLNAKTAPPPPPKIETALPPKPQAAPSPRPIPPEPEPEPELEGEPAPSFLLEPEEEPEPEEERPAPLSMDIVPEMETVEDPDKKEQKGPSERETAMANAQALANLKNMFEEGRLDLILQTYAALPGTRVKQRIVEGLLERLDQWKIEPILAAAALENDEKMFRQILRLLLKGDKARICQQIQLQSYSPDLQKVAVTVLGELGLRSSILKLKDALVMKDPIVRCVALNGIARAGKAAEEYIPLLVDAARSDPNKGVRLAAVKAIQTMNLREAYEALEKETPKGKFDAKMFEIIDAMREKYGAAPVKKNPSQLAKEKEKAKKAAQTRKKVMLVLVLLMCLALAGWYFVTYLKPH